MNRTAVTINVPGAAIRVIERRRVVQPRKQVDAIVQPRGTKLRILRRRQHVDDEKRGQAQTDQHRRRRAGKRGPLAQDPENDRWGDRKRQVDRERLQVLINPFRLLVDGVCRGDAQRGADEDGEPAKVDLLAFARLGSEMQEKSRTAIVETEFITAIRAAMIVPTSADKT